MWESQKNNETQIIENQKTSEKQEFISFLKNWVKISSENDFKKLQENVKKYNFWNNLLWDVLYNSIAKNKEEFFLKLEWNDFRVYSKVKNSVENIFRRYSNYPILIWIINDSWEYKEMYWDEIYIQNEYSQFWIFENRINQIRKESQERLKNLKNEVVDDEPYKIQKGDTLWKIVKEKYGLTDNRDIANTINSLVRYNSSIKKLKTDVAPPDGIRWDLIIVWKNIILPWELKVLWKSIKKSKT
mgnify:CR=1 FL=1